MAKKNAASGGAVIGGGTFAGGSISGAAAPAAPKIKTTTPSAATTSSATVKNTMSGTGNAYGGTPASGTGSFTGGEVAGTLAKALPQTSTATTTAKTSTPYDDFVAAARNAGLYNSFDQNDLDFAKKYPEYGMSLINLMGDLGKAQTNEQRLLATEAINQLRKNYGSYWTGDKGNRSYATSYGSKIGSALDEIGNYDPFEYSRAGEYDDMLTRLNGYDPFQYSGKTAYQDLLNQVTGFNYDPDTDPLFSAYRKQYSREGDRASANALAQAAAATGGRPSSYATTAAAQAGNYYAGQLADRIPELAKQRLDTLLQGLGAMDTQRNQEYQEYSDAYTRLLNDLAAMDTQRNQEFEVYNNRYDQLNQNLRNLQGQDEIDYKRYLDMLNAEYQRDRDAVADAQQEWNNAWAIYQQTGKITGPLKNVIKEPKTAASSGTGGGGSSGGGGGSGGSASSKKTTTAAPTTSAIKKTGTSVSGVNNTKAAPAPLVGGGGIKVNMTK